MVFKKNITKEEISTLPLRAFEGDITLIDEFSNFREVVDYLKEQPVLGFDTETRPNFRKGRSNKVALLQLSTADKAFLFRLNKIKLPEELAKILANPDIIKVGVAIRDDIRILQKLTPFTPESFIDLQDYVKKFDIESNGLKKLSAIILNFRISKRQQLSNWEDEDLTEAQIKYAATDAWVCYEVYNKLKQHSEK